jgi:hypothetical protein
MLVCMIVIVVVVVIVSHVVERRMVAQVLKLLAKAIE